MAQIIIFTSIFGLKQFRQIPQKKNITTIMTEIRAEKNLPVGTFCTDTFWAVDHHFAWRSSWWHL